MPRPPPNLTPAQMAIAAERRAAREIKRASQAAAGPAPPGDQDTDTPVQAKVLLRDWVRAGRGSRGPSDGGLNELKRGVRVISWNILAQTLIRRELFPGSDSLRWGDRKSMLEAELGHYGRIADILCLQECDRLQDLIHSMPFNKCVQGKGHGKQHGLVICYKSEKFGFRGTKVVHLDEAELSPMDEKDDDDSEAGKRRRRGGTRQTKNVGLMVGLEDKEREGKGVVVVTAHLFWHPIYQYERVRQFIVLIRAVRAFQKENDLQAWPVIMAGDFNTSPCEPPYQLLVNPSAPLQSHALQRLEDSRMTHLSVDKIGIPPIPRGQLPTQSASPSASGTGTNTPAPTPQSTNVKDRDEAEGEGEGEGVPDAAIAKTRPSEPSDGILSVEQLQAIMKELVGPGLKSSYDISGWNGEGDDTFTSRLGWPESPAEHGRSEPAYTCYTKLFKLTLDYLFILPPPLALDGEDRVDVQVQQVLRPAKKDELGEGLPMKGKGASDHLAVGCEVVW